MAEFSSKTEETNTLEDSLKQFGMECLLEELDLSLELLRRNKTTREEHLDVLKSVDKNLLKQSLNYHPDIAINRKKTEQEVEDSQNRQVALNATRTVLQALTKAFLNDIDIHYRYEFFAKMNISFLMNEKEMGRQIQNVLSKIGYLSEIKRVNIVGEIRKFLQESLKSLESFQVDDKNEFERHRDYTLHHLRKCIEGYEVLATECELVVKECIGEQDGSTIRKIHDQSRTEMKILQELKRVAEKSLNGQFQVFSVYVSANSYDRYLISPFVLYINVMLMCTTVISRKLAYTARVKNLFNLNSLTTYTFDTKPELFSKAYKLASYFNNKTQYEWQVENILLKKRIAVTTDNIIKEFKEVLKLISDFLAEEFDINTYKEGKTDRDHFVEKLSILNESRTGYKEVKKLLEQCEKESDEIREEVFKYCAKIQETEQSRKNILKCKSTDEEISKLMSDGCYHKEGTGNGSYYGSELNEANSCNEIKEESTETILTKKLEDYEKVAENLLEFLKGCTGNVPELSKESRSSFESQNRYTLVITEEVEKKIKRSNDLNKEIDEHLCCLMQKKNPKFVKPSGVIGDHFEVIQKSNKTIAVDENKEGSDSEEVEKLLEQFKKESDEIHEEYSKYSSKLEETEEQSRKNILKCNTNADDDNEERPDISDEQQF